MNKFDFAAELHELSQQMTEDEIKKAIEALNECRDRIYTNNSEDKKELSRTLKEAGIEEAVVRFRKSEHTDMGELKVYGATLLRYEDYMTYVKELPHWPGAWWLYNKMAVKDDKIECTANTACIRPVLILSNPDQAGLRPGDVFFIGTDRFKLITRTQAIMCRCLKDVCTYLSEYDSSIVRFCIEGWYAGLLRRNRTDSSSECVKSGT